MVEVRGDACMLKMWLAGCVSNQCELQNCEQEGVFRRDTSDKMQMCFGHRAKNPCKGFKSCGMQLTNGSQEAVRHATLPPKVKDSHRPLVQGYSIPLEYTSIQHA